MDGHNFMLNKYSGELIGAKMIVNNDGGERFMYKFVNTYFGSMMLLVSVINQV